MLKLWLAFVWWLSQKLSCRFLLCCWGYNYFFPFLDSDRFCSYEIFFPSLRLGHDCMSAFSACHFKDYGVWFARVAEFDYYFDVTKSFLWQLFERRKGCFWCLLPLLVSVWVFRSEKNGHYLRVDLRLLLWKRRDYPT